MYHPIFIRVWIYIYLTGICVCQFASLLNQARDDILISDNKNQVYSIMCIEQIL